MAVVMVGPDVRDVWTFDVARGTLSILTPDRANDRSPLWSPNGDRVVFRSDREPQGLFWKAADGRGAVEPLLAGEEVEQLSFLTPPMIGHPAGTS